MMALKLLLAAVLALPAFAAEEKIAPVVEPVRADAPSLSPAVPLLLEAGSPLQLSPSRSLESANPLALPAAALPQSALPAAAKASDHPFVAQARANVARQLDAMAERHGKDETLMRSISETADAFLDRIDEHVKAGEIDPTIDFRMHPGDAAKPLAPRTARVGFYPVAADPFHWGHLLIGLQAMADLRLDKVVYVLAGDDPRKPKMTPASVRHPMGEHVLSGFGPLFGYSPLAVGTTYDGEYNLFRFLAENSAQYMNVFYLVGDDHYRLKDKNGNDDTLPKLEKNRLREEFAYEPERHQVSAAFIEREGRIGERISTPLEVQFLPNIPFEASSTNIRNGYVWLMPWDAWKWVYDRGLALYGVGEEPSAPAK